MSINNQTARMIDSFKKLSERSDKNEIREKKNKKLTIKEKLKMKKGV